MSKSRTQKLVDKLYNQAFIKKIKLQERVDRKNEIEESQLQGMFKPNINKNLIENELLFRKNQTRKRPSTGSLQYSNSNTQMNTNHNIPKTISSTPSKNKSNVKGLRKEDLATSNKKMKTKEKIMGINRRNSNLFHKMEIHGSVLSNANFEKKIH